MAKAQVILQPVGNHRAFDTEHTPELHLIFVHGWTGDYEKTWGEKPASGKSGFYWPNAMADEKNGVGKPRWKVWSLDYPAPVTDGEQFGNSTSLAQAVRDCLINNLQDSTPFAFVCHSFGGILVKRFLLMSANGCLGENKLHERCLGIHFVATPHFGSDLARVLNYLLSLGKKITGLTVGKAIEWMTKSFGFEAIAERVGAVLGEAAQNFVPGSSDVLKELGDQIGLAKLNQHFALYYAERAHRIPLQIRISVELNRTFGGRIVSKESADPFLLKTVDSKPLSFLEIPKDHIEICKPTNSNDGVYTATYALLVDIANRKEVLVALEKYRGNPYLYSIYWVLFEQNGLAKHLLSANQKQYRQESSQKELALSCVELFSNCGDYDQTVAVLDNLKKAIHNLTGNQGPHTSSRTDIEAAETIAGYLICLALRQMKDRENQQINPSVGSQVSLPRRANKEKASLAELKSPEIFHFWLEAAKGINFNEPLRFQIARETASEFVKSLAVILPSELFSSSSYDAKALSQTAERASLLLAQTSRLRFETMMSPLDSSVLEDQDLGRAQRKAKTQFEEGRGLMIELAEGQLRDETFMQSLREALIESPVCQWMRYIDYWDDFAAQRGFFRGAGHLQQVCIDFHLECSKEKARYSK